MPVAREGYEKISSPFTFFWYARQDSNTAEAAPAESKAGTAVFNIVLTHKRHFDILDAGKIRSLFIIQSTSLLQQDW